MAEVGALLVETFSRYLAPLLVLANTANRSEGFAESEKVLTIRSQVGDSSENKTR